MPQEVKKYNTKLGSGFGNDDFGEGSIKVDVTAEGLDSIMKNLQVGGAILLRYNKVTIKGNKHYFAEILPPYNPTGNAGKGKKTGTTKTSDLD